MAEQTEIQNKVQYLPTAKLKLHPNNPRFIRDKDFDILCKSIQDHPDYFEARPLLCTPDFVVFAGNMRLRAAKFLKLKQVPAIIMDIPPERVQELMMRDNIQNGEWDTEALAGMFEVTQLREWGMPDFVFGAAQPAYEPNTAPLTATRAVTPADVERAADGLESRFQQPREDGKVEFICPHCGETFLIDRSDITPQV